MPHHAMSEPWEPWELLDWSETTGVLDWSETTAVQAGATQALAETMQRNKGRWRGPWLKEVDVRHLTRMLKEAAASINVNIEFNEHLLPVLRCTRCGRHCDAFESAVAHATKHRRPTPEPAQQLMRAIRQIQGCSAASSAASLARHEPRPQAVP